MRLRVRQRVQIQNGKSGPLFNEAGGALIVEDAGAVTYTPDEISGPLVLRDPAGAARADLFPLAADMLAVDPNAIPGDSFQVTIRNTADADEAITMTTNTGLTLSGTMTIAENYQRTFLVAKTGPTTVTIYSLGTVLF